MGGATALGTTNPTLPHLPPGVWLFFASIIGPHHGTIRQDNTMWIQFTTTHDDGRHVLRGLKLPWMDAPVEVSANGKANVPKEVGERLVEERDDVESTDTNSDDYDYEEEVEEEPAATDVMEDTEVADLLSDDEDYDEDED